MWSQISKDAAVPIALAWAMDCFHLTCHHDNRTPRRTRNACFTPPRMYVPAVKHLLERAKRQQAASDAAVALTPPRPTSSASGSRHRFSGPQPDATAERSPPPAAAPAPQQPSPDSDTALTGDLAEQPAEVLLKQLSRSEQERRRCATATSSGSPLPRFV